MPVELPHILMALAGLVLGWLARHKGILAPAGSPAITLPPPLPGATPLPAAPPSLLSGVMPFLMQLAEQELQAHMAQIAARILPPPEPAKVPPTP